jgi:hypothetical protein
MTSKLETTLTDWLVSKLILSSFACLLEGGNEWGKGEWSDEGVMHMDTGEKGKEGRCVKRWKQGWGVIALV